MRKGAIEVGRERIVALSPLSVFKLRAVLEVAARTIECI